MKIMNRILKEDIESFSLPEDLAAQLRDSKIIVTGATGLIGSIFVRCIHSIGIGVHFILPVRDKEKAARIFEDEKDSLTIIQTGLKEFFEETDIDCDYIIHCASPTAGQYICRHPSETFMLAVESTKAILDYSRRKNVKGVVYLSSIEYYGQIYDDRPVMEDMLGHIDHKSARSSYSLGKQAAEYIAFCYAGEYDVPVKTARLTQTFGAGISIEDNRVFAQFARSVIEHKDIVLHTTGESAKPYCYTIDSISALIYILLKGIPGESYNVATPGTYVTIRELAELCRDTFSPDINVTIDLQEHTGYAPDTKVNLNSDKLQSLGWQPGYGLPKMLERLIDYLKVEA